MWFESVAVAQQRARRVLPRPVYDALLAGSETGMTMHDNVAAFAELGWLPVVVDQPAVRDMATSVMGQPLSMPVLISPTGVQAVHPDGEVAAARAAAERGVAYGLSSFARHQAAGAVPVAVPARSTVRADVDTLAEALACGGVHTMAVLAEFAPVAGATAAAGGRGDQVDGSHRWVPGS